jgi:hypothetical protein
VPAAALNQPNQLEYNVSVAQMADGTGRITYWATGI